MNTITFASYVLDLVTENFQVDNAEFFQGTLFVKCDIPTAVKIETFLLEKLSCGIIFSRVGAESAYDFI